MNVSKAEFARLCNVSKAAVAKWIAGGKIGGAALVGDGRTAQINVELAQRQLGIRRDPGQATGNGLKTRLRASAHVEPEQPDEPLECTEAADEVHRKIALAKLEDLERRNRAAADEEKAREGRFVLAADVAAAMNRMAGEIVSLFRAALPDTATTVAAKLKLESRDVEHELREQFNATLRRLEPRLVGKAQALPPIVYTPDHEHSVPVHED